MVKCVDRQSSILQLIATIYCREGEDGRNLISWDFCIWIFLSKSFSSFFTKIDQKILSFFWWFSLILVSQKAPKYLPGCPLERIFVKWTLHLKILRIFQTFCRCISKIVHRKNSPKLSLAIHLLYLTMFQ